MKKLLEQAYQFLKDHPDINEVKLSNGIETVHVIRFTPGPVTYSGYTPTWTYGQADSK